jgi:hypothetical protein
MREAETGYVCPSQYYRQIQRYLEYFNREQLLVVEQQALRERRVETLSSIFSFLGVSEEFHSAGFERSSHQTASKRMPTRLGLMAYAMPGVRALRDSLPWPLTTPVRAPTISAETRARLEDLLRDDVESLRGFSGLRLDGWLR